jgi:hypothetical protein
MIKTLEKEEDGWGLLERVFMDDREGFPDHVILETRFAHKVRKKVIRKLGDGFFTHSEELMQKH